MLPYTTEYEHALAEYHTQRAAIEAAILAKQAKIQRLQAQIDGLTARRCKLHCPNWIDAIVRPLADDLAKQIGKHVRVLGPFGLRAEVGIYLTDMPDGDWTWNESWPLKTVHVAEGREEEYLLALVAADDKRHHVEHDGNGLYEVQEANSGRPLFAILPVED